MQPPPPGPLGDCLRDWEDLQQDFQNIQETHRLYRLKLEELTKLQNNCTSSITRQKKRLQELALALKKCKPSLPAEAEGAAQELENQMKERQGLFFDMEAYLPKKNGLYLSLVLGNVNVTLLSKQAKFAYKDEYEKFKLYLTIILILISFTCRFLLNSRVTDAAFNFLLVWYYCTLTIRESILINNGSRWAGWALREGSMEWGARTLREAGTGPGGDGGSLLQDQRLVGVPSLRVHLPVGSHADVARWSHVPEIPEPIPLLFHVPELRAVSPVLLPERLPLPPAGAGRAAHHGPHCGGLPVLDVAGPHLPAAFSFLWTLLAAF
ncbi:TMEM120A isoform 7 [Pan troglodytes]|uniref:TMEM120A isoform 2 n=1 Tax=Pan troglodytes TaxID=9598 RepID=A0A2J8PX31_PANTR|nr:TMEM120A isoform 2 [Pan troglodytes]PNI88584.1 TMEM120A isoform 3 [Pan troglodytes]PNI88588.1 TMEM120A isoform 7 [Pan troglodytes]